MAITWCCAAVKFAAGMSVAIGGTYLTKQPLLQGALFGGGMVFGIQGPLQPICERVGLGVQSRKWAWLTVGMLFSAACNTGAFALSYSFAAGILNTVGCSGGIILANRDAAMRICRNCFGASQLPALNQPPSPPPSAA